MRLEPPEPVATTRPSRKRSTVGDIIDLIDRSVAVDGTRPAGTFYFMETTDSARSDPRDGLFDGAVTAIQALGGDAVPLGLGDFFFAPDDPLHPDLEEDDDDEVVSESELEEEQQQDQQRQSGNRLDDLGEEEDPRL